MKEYISLDAHKRYSLLAREKIDGSGKLHERVEHRRGAIREALRGIEPGTTVAVEATGNWYWIVGEIEEAGGVPALVHPHKAKVMMGCINKTDKLDADGMNRLQRVGTLPVVWIAPAGLRDLRELPRTRRIALRKGHQKAVGAVARHLAEATFHVLSRGQDYKDPGREPRACDQGKRTSATAA
jgi:hypothetical protein